MGGFSEWKMTPSVRVRWISIVIPPAIRRKKRRVGLIVTNVVASLVLVVSILSLSGLMVLNMSFRDQSMGNVEGGIVNSLTRCGEKHKRKRHLFSHPRHRRKGHPHRCDHGRRFDHGNNALNILQIPRDTFIGTDIPSGKVNAVYGNATKGESKIEFLIRRINAYFGLPIDHYVLVHLSAFRTVVDAVGGVDIDIPNRITVNDSGSRQEYTLGPGLTHLNGNQAEGFVRNRSGKGYGSGDMARVEAQRRFYAAFAKKVMDMGMASMVRIVTSCYDQFKTDMTVGQLLGYAKEMKQVGLDNIKIYAVPGQGGYYTPPGMRQELSYFSIHKDDYVDLINEHFLPYSPHITESQLKIIELHTSKTQSWIKGEEGFSSLVPSTSGE